MIELLILFRAFNLYAHHAHNLCKGDEFFQDHSFFAELYEFADASYDSIIERHIGTTDNDIDLKSIVAESLSIISEMDNGYMETSLTMMQELLKAIDTVSKSDKLSTGTINMLQDISDKIEVFIYKAKRRLM